MSMKPTRRLFVGIQIVGSACSIASLFRGTQILAIDLSDWTGVAWLAGFVVLGLVAIVAGRKASRTLRQSGTERGHWRTHEVEVFYPTPYKSPPHLRLSKLHLRGRFGSPVTSSGLINREVVATQQREDGFTAVIRGASGNTRSARFNWSFKWKAKGVPDYCRNKDV